MGLGHLCTDTARWASWGAATRPQWNPPMVDRGLRAHTPWRASRGGFATLPLCRQAGSRCALTAASSEILASMPSTASTSPARQKETIAGWNCRMTGAWPCARHASACTRAVEARCSVVGVAKVIATLCCAATRLLPRQVCTRRAAHVAPSPAQAPPCRRRPLRAGVRQQCTLLHPAYCRQSCAHLGWLLGCGS